MDREQALQELRRPFAPEQIGKLPRVWCKACRDTQSKNCNEHSKTKCNVCNNKISSAHMHLDFVNHGLVTDRLLSVDPEWTWEPLATDQAGLPAFDNQGGLWIKLTVAGVTRLGYGDAEGKRGPDAIKETISTALRNAAMRFGVALELWAQMELDLTDSTSEQSSSTPAPQAIPEQARRGPPQAQPSETNSERSGEAVGKTVDAVMGEVTERPVQELINELTQERADELVTFMEGRGFGTEVDKLKPPMVKQVRKKLTELHAAQALEDPF